jgi:hypothetical protein
VAEERGRARAAPGPLAFWALALALLALAPLAKASVPRAVATDGAALLVASLTESSRLAPLAASDDVERFALFAGDDLARALAPLALASRVRENPFSLHLGADVFGLEPLRGPPSLSEDLCQGDDECLAGTRIGGLTLLEPFAQKGEPKLTLELQWACGVSSCGLADGKPLDPWGLSEQTMEMKEQACRVTGTGCPGDLGTVDLEAVAKEAAATAVEELSYVGIANGLSSSLLGYDFVRNEEVKGPLARVLAGVSVVPGIPATIRKLSDVPVPSGLLRQADEVAEAAAARAKKGGRETAMASRPAEDAVSEALAVPTNREAPRETVRIPGTSRSGFRVTDLQALGENGTIALRGSIVEVKDVARLEARGQIRDFITFAEGQGLKVEIFTNAPEPVRGKIADAIRRGTVVLRPIPKKKS